MTITIPSGRTLPLQAKAGGGFESFGIPSVDPAPSAPPVFTTTANATSISATVSEANGATRYNVRVDSGAAQNGTVVTGLNSETSYSFQIQGENDSGVSDWSTAVSVTTLAANAHTGSTPAERQFTIDINGVGGTPGEVVRAPTGTKNGKDVFVADSAGSDYTVYTNEILWNGENVIKCAVPQGSTGAGSLGGSVTLNLSDKGTPLQRGDEFWVKTTIYFPESPTWQFNTGRNKFFRNRVFDSVGGSSPGYIDLYLDGQLSADDFLFFWVYEGVNSPRGSDGNASPVVRNVWHTIEMYVKLDNVAQDSGGMARSIIWYDGVVMRDITNRITLSTQSQIVNQNGLFMYYGNETAPADLKCYIKDYVIQTSTPPNSDANGFPFIGSDV